MHCINSCRCISIIQHLIVHPWSPLSGCWAGFKNINHTHKGQGALPGWGDRGAAWPWRGGDADPQQGTPQLPNAAAGLVRTHKPRVLLWGAKHQILQGNGDSAPVQFQLFNTHIPHILIFGKYWVFFSPLPGRYSSSSSEHQLLPGHQKHLSLL